MNTDTARTDPDREDAARLLDAAADLLTRYGWCQGGYWPGADTVGADTVGGGHYIDGDPCCMVGALGVCCGITDPDHLDQPCTTSMQAAALAADTVAELLALPCEQLEDWNDDPHRTPGEVIDALHAAARQLREANRVRPPELVLLPPRRRTRYPARPTTTPAARSTAMPSPTTTGHPDEEGPFTNATEHPDPDPDTDTGGDVAGPGAAEVVGPVLEGELLTDAENAELDRRLGGRAVAVRRATLARSAAPRWRARRARSWCGASPTGPRSSGGWCCASRCACIRVWSPGRVGCGTPAPSGCIAARSGRRKRWAIRNGCGSGPTARSRSLSGVTTG